MSNPKKDWNKIVSESGGRSIFLPEKFRKQAEEWLKMRADYNSVVNSMAKKELTLNILFQNLIFDIRMHLEENGRGDIYLKDVGFEVNALEDGKFVINIIDAPQSQIPTR